MPSPESPTKRTTAPRRILRWGVGGVEGAIGSAWDAMDLDAYLSWSATPDERFVALVRNVAPTIFHGWSEIRSKAMAHARPIVKIPDGTSQEPVRLSPVPKARLAF